MATNEQARGRIGWYDLSTTDIQGAIDFYAKVIGWEAEAGGSPDMPYYTLIDPLISPKRCFGGIMDLPEAVRAMGVPPNWTPYVVVHDLEETCARVTELGGKVIHPPTSIPNVGSFAVLTDSQGAVFYLYRAAGEAPGHDDPKGPGEVSWHELATNDQAAAFAFYEALFGWKKMDAVDVGGDASVYQIFGRGELALGGMYNKKGQSCCMWLLYFKVEDINAAVERVKAAGGTVQRGVTKIPDMCDLVAHCTDPQGAVFALHACTKK